MKKKNKLKDIDVKSIKIGKKKNIIMRHKFLFFISVLMFIAIGIMHKNSVFVQILHEDFL